MSRVVRMTMTIGAVLAALTLAPAARAAPEHWSTGPDLPVERTNAATAALHDGRVLAIGGAVLGGTPGVARSVERFDPSTSAWTGGVHDMGVARYSPVAVTLADGRVLVAGGVGSASVALRSAELYDPAANHWTPTANEMSRARVSVGGLNAVATLLADGRVLFAGADGSNGAPSTAVEVFDPTTDTFTAVQPMNHARALASQTLLKDGRVLVAGGIDGSAAIASAEVYDPAHDTWTDVANAMADGHAASLLVTLPNGQALIGGGVTTDGGVFATGTDAELYDPGSNRFSSTGPMHAAHFNGVVVPLPGGRVLAAGGANSTASPPHADPAAEIYQPSTGTWTAAVPMPTGVLWPAASGLPDGRVLIAGGTEALAPVDDTQIYTPYAPPVTVPPSVPTAPPTTPPATAPSVTAPPRVPTPAVRPDTTAPRIKITGLKRRLKRKTLLRGLRFTVKPSERSRLQIKLLGVKHAKHKRAKHKSAKTKRAKHKRTKRLRYTVRLASKSFALGGRHRLRLKPKRSRLSHARRFTIRLRIVATDAAGNHRTTTRTVRVSR